MLYVCSDLDDLAGEPVMPEGALVLDRERGTTAGHRVGVPAPELVLEDQAGRVGGQRRVGPAEGRPHVTPIDDTPAATAGPGLIRAKPLGTSIREDVLIGASTDQPRSVQ